VTSKILIGLVLAGALLHAQGVIEGRVINVTTRLGIDGVAIAFFTGVDLAMKRLPGRREDFDSPMSQRETTPRL
jgi:hypothetical protein